MTKEQTIYGLRNILWLKIVLIALSFLYIAYKVYDFFFVKNTSFEVVKYFNPFIIYLSVFVPFLLLLETFKWRLLVKKTTNLSFRNSLRAVLTGISLGIFTPYRLGDYAGRISMLSPEKKTVGLIACGINSLGLELAHLVFFYIAVAFIYMENRTMTGWGGVIIVAGLFLAVFSTVFLFSRLNFFVPFLSRLKRIKKYLGHLESSSLFSSQTLLQVFGLDLVKVILYQLQFVLMLMFMGCEVPFLHLLASVSISYFIISLVPVIPVGNFGIKGSIHLFVLNNMIHDPLVVVAASFFIWSMNLAFPAIVGNYLLAKQGRFGLNIAKIR